MLWRELWRQGNMANSRERLIKYSWKGAATWIGKEGEKGRESERGNLGRRDADRQTNTRENRWGEEVKTGILTQLWRKEGCDMSPLPTERRLMTHHQQGTDTTDTTLETQRRRGGVCFSECVSVLYWYRCKHVPCVTVLAKLWSSPVIWKERRHDHVLLKQRTVLQREKCINTTKYQP